MIRTTEAQIILLRAAGLEILVSENSYICFSSLLTVTESEANTALSLLNYGKTYQQILDEGLLADWAGFEFYLKSCDVFKAASMSGVKTPAVRKLLFELVFWVGNSVEPNLLSACWVELNTVTRGAIASSLKLEQLLAWNKAIRQYRMSATFLIPIPKPPVT